MTRRRPCPAARLIAAELRRDLAEQSFRRTRARRAHVRLVDATTEALKRGPVAKLGWRA